MTSKALFVNLSIWVVLSEGLIPEKQIYQFVLFGARHCEKQTTDVKVINCNDTLEAFLKGETTRDQLIHAANLVARAASSPLDRAGCATSASHYAATLVGNGSGRYFTAGAARYVSRAALHCADNEEELCEFLIKLLTEGDL